MKNIFNSIKRTPYQSLATFLILVFTLFLTLFFFNLISFFYGILSYVETKPQIIVYFQTQTPEIEIFKIKDSLASSGKTTSIKYISQKEALEIYKQLNKDNPLLLEMVSAEILPASLEINAKKPEYLLEMAEFLKKQPGVDEVQFQKEIINQISNISNNLRRIAFFIFIYLTITTFLVIITTTAFKIAFKKEEIELLRLLGASKFYVKIPYLLEGVFFGFVSSLTAFIIYYGIFFYFKPFLLSYFYGIPSLPFLHFEKYQLYVWPPSAEYLIFTFIILSLFGTIIGFIGNYLATTKYIK